METTTLKIGGMTCGGCVRSVTRVLQALPGVARAEVSLENGEARVEFDPARASLAQMKGAIENAGYEAP
ncbi:MAG TPA: heavy-metal-associated domain-containing protein [Burkholderiales bacterium]|jgi:copper chaperone|nr:heavy-metal-associated domain-containing protein [Burkholderiales bacterium]